MTCYPYGLSKKQRNLLEIMKYLALNRDKYSQVVFLVIVPTDNWNSKREGNIWG